MSKTNIFFSRNLTFGNVLVFRNIEIKLKQYRNIHGRNILQIFWSQNLCNRISWPLRLQRNLYYHKIKMNWQNDIRIQWKDFYTNIQFIGFSSAFLRFTKSVDKTSRLVSIPLDTRFKLNVFKCENWFWKLFI